ncbi:MAG: transposase [Microgenomates group bacterium]|jgi:putative transposase
MPYDQAVFAVGEFYHVYNRGVEKRTTFLDDRDYQRFLQTIEYYRFKNPPTRFSTRNRPYLKQKILKEELLIEIVCFCLMPNHFHLELKQNTENGITEFMRKVLNSYTKYFNTKHKRVGPLFQGAFKAKHIEDEEQLIHLSRYIHLNPIIDYLVKKLALYKYSSFLEFIGSKKGFCQTSYVINHFPNTLEYENFVLDQEDYGRSIKALERTITKEEKSEE